MINKVQYYIDLILTLCGYDGVIAEVSWGAIMVVIVALLIVMYAFYKSIVFTIWPSESRKNHIKRVAMDNMDGIKK